MALATALRYMNENETLCGYEANTTSADSLNDTQNISLFGATERTW